MGRMKRWINRLSVKKKLIFYGYLIITPVLILLCGILFWYNYNKEMERRLNSDLSGVNALADGVQVMQNDIKDFSTYICINNDVRKLLVSKNISELNENSKLWLEDAPMEIVQDMISLKGHIKTIAIYPENGVRPYLRCMDGGAYISEFDTVRNTEVYNATQESDSRILWKSIDKQGVGVYLNNRTEKVVLCRELYDLAQKKPLAYIVIGVSKTYFEDLVANIVQNEKEGVLILDKYGGELCRSGNVPKQVEKYLTKDNFVSQDYKKRKTKFTYGEYDIVCRQKDRNASIVCKIVPKYNMQMRIMDIAYIPIILLFGILAGLLPVLLIISNIVTKPLHQLQKAIVKFSTGDFEQRVEVATEDEIGEVAKCFNKMVENIKELIDENYVITLKEKESELAALQAQINPHFLYNTLDSLYWQATESENEEIAESILALSQLFRLVLCQGKREVMISQEMELVARYLQLQQMRFMNRLHYKIEVDEEVKTAWIPKLIIQPFVENAVVHGFENTTTPCHLTVTVKHIGDRIVFRVEDTGIGMRQDQIAEIWEEEPADYAKQRIGGYAIKNIRERLQLFYHDKFELNIKSDVGKGTVVTLSVPFVS